MARKKLTALQKEYNKQRKRLQAAIRRGEKKGYIFPEDVLPKIPKRITKASVSRLAKIKPQQLYKNAVLLSTETGEIIPGLEARKLSRKGQLPPEFIPSPPQLPETTLQYSSWAQGVYDNFIEDIAGFPAPIRERIKQLTDNIINTVGIEAFAEGLQIMPDDFSAVLHEAQYDSNSAPNEFAQRLLNYIPDIGILELEELSEMIEQDGTW